MREVPITSLKANPTCHKNCLHANSQECPFAEQGIVSYGPDDDLKSFVEWETPCNEPCEDFELDIDSL